MKRLWSLALCTLMCAPLLVVASESISGAAPTQLFPDLHTLAPRELRFDRADITPDLTGVFHNVLRFSNDTYNAGEGPLIVNAHDQPDHAVGAVDATRDEQRRHVHRLPAEQRHLLARRRTTTTTSTTGAHYQLWTQVGVRRVDRERPHDRRADLHRREDHELRHRRGVHHLRAERGVPRPVRPGRLRRRRAAATSTWDSRSVGATPTTGTARSSGSTSTRTRSANGTYVLRSVADPLNIVYESANKADPTRESVQRQRGVARRSSIADGSILDSDPPTGTVAINHVDKTTASTNVSVDVVGRDDVSGVNQFRLSNDGTTFKTFNYTSSGSVPTTVSWNLADAATGGNVEQRHPHRVRAGARQQRQVGTDVHRHDRPRNGRRIHRHRLLRHHRSSYAQASSATRPRATGDSTRRREPPRPTASARIPAPTRTARRSNAAEPA